MSKTIYALASGVGRSGVGVVRISGDNAFDCAKQLGVKNFTPNKLARTNLFANNGDLIDEAMAVAFKNPNSFTGEDVVELHIHGSQAILNVLFDELDKQGARLAEPGEFSKRAFANNKMDLTQAEGLIDLINAETKAQMRQAQRQTQGALRDLYNSWADELLPLLAHCEAYIDFPDEDLPESVKKQTDEKIQNLISSILNHLEDNNRGERIRNGIQVAIIGSPNAGKSSLINALTKRDVAIVSEQAGTTRDVIEVNLDIKGYPVRLFDTAGIRESDDVVESEGIKRAVKSANQADVIILVIDGVKNKINDELILQNTKSIENDNAPLIILANKNENSGFNTPQTSKSIIPMSTYTGDGIDKLVNQLYDLISGLVATDSEPIITRNRHRRALQDCLDSLIQSQTAPVPELVAEDLRISLRHLGIITGTVDVEELLDVVFKDFCIGK